MGKLKSRKLWICICVCAYFAVMTIREQGMESTLSTIIYTVGCIVVVLTYLAIEGRLDYKNENKENIDLEEEQENG